MTLVNPWLGNKSQVVLCYVRNPPLFVALVLLASCRGDISLVPRLVPISWSSGLYSLVPRFPRSGAWKPENEAGSGK